MTRQSNSLNRISLQRQVAALWVIVFATTTTIQVHAFSTWSDTRAGGAPGSKILGSQTKRHDKSSLSTSAAAKATAPAASLTGVAHSFATRKVTTTTTTTTALAMASPSEESSSSSSTRPFYLDPNTKGGALVLMVVLFVVPYVVYQVLVSAGNMDEIDAGIAVGMGFTIFSMLAWVSTYIFRVATKDMTYVRC
jgi:Protein of unknown function (DUF3007)